MSRLRATLSTLPIDREVAGHVDAAQRSIRAALRACDGSESNPVQRRRVMAVRRDLEKILGAMTTVRRVGALYDLNDPDLTGTPVPPRPKREAPAAPVAPAVDGE